MREDLPERGTKADRLGFFVGQTATDSDANEKLVKYARAVELGRAVGRDIGGADPERMAPPRFADYIHELFDKSSGIKVMALTLVHCQSSLVRSIGRDQER